MIPQTIAQTESLAFGHWIAEVDDLINREILECFPRSWSEDFISYKWLLALTRRFRHVTIADLDLPFTVSWDAYKADGAIETRYGDIGVIVNFSFSVRSKIATATGVGFLEAKRIDAKGGNYPHMEWEQLRREASNIAGHRVLLYDFEDVNEASLNLQALGFCQHLDAAPFGSVHATVAITQHVLAVKDRSRSIGALGIPLGYQLCARYLRGLDLDYTLDPATIFENIPGGTGYLIVANVEESGTTKKRGQPVPSGYSPIHEKQVQTWAMDGQTTPLQVEQAAASDELDLSDLIEQFNQNPLLRRGPELIEDEEEPGAPTVGV